MADIKQFIADMPKCELHVHLEGTLDAEMKLKLAARNGVSLPYGSADEIRASYVHHDLQSFLKVFYEGRFVLVEEQDFYDLCFAYLEKASSQNVLYAEAFFDPQQHTGRGVPIATVLRGLRRAQADAEAAFGIRSQLIMCFLRDKSAASAMDTLVSALPYKDGIVAVGLDSDEKDNPPSKFAAVFARAREEGLRLTAHCDVDQENINGHIRQAILDLGVERIDHGINVLDDPDMVALARARGLPFTLCPYPNGVVRPSERQASVRRFLDLGLKATLNSDDPAYMDGHYINESFELAQREAGLGAADLITLTRNAFEAAWIDPATRDAYLARVDAYARRHGVSAG